MLPSYTYPTAHDLSQSGARRGMCAGRTGIVRDDEYHVNDFKQVSVYS